MSANKLVPIKEMGMNILKNSVISVFLCILMNMSFGVLQNYLGKYTELINQIFDIAFIFVLLYGSASDYGSKDYTLVTFGNAEKDYLRGLKAGLFALIPYYVLTFPLLVLKILMLPAFDKYLKIYKVLMSPFMVICKNVFDGKDVMSVSYLSLGLMFILPFVAVAGVFVSYVIGYKKINVSETLIYKNK